MVELLSELRTPPVEGRFYLVPVIRGYPWNGRVRDWPVLGPKHEDAEFFNFAEPHYHVDIRFLDRRTAAWAASRLWCYKDPNGEPDSDLALVASAYPLASRGWPLPNGRPSLKKLRCRIPAYTTRLGRIAEVAMAGMIARYGSPAPAIQRPDGRLLCPHRKVDLSQFPADERGIVTCPLHGLRVCVGKAA